MHGRLWLFNLEIKMVSKLKKQKIRDIWKTEDRDFTPWLVENIELLNEDLGLNIQAQGIIGHAHRHLIDRM